MGSGFYMRPPTQEELMQQRVNLAYTQPDAARRQAGQAFRFYVEIDGVLSAEFTECNGLTVDRDIYEITAGGVNDFIYKKPGRLKWSNITLRRGITYTRALWDWFMAGKYGGPVTRKNFSIILGNAQLKKVKHWDVIAAFPVKWSGADLSTSTLEVALESIEIAHHGLQLSQEEDNTL
jgi:phage tail-like protein